ncbi:unnamed protein product [Rotaria magnacalcarata]|uniref:Liprin-beta-1/2 coiled-coil domain-containing protein n=1 Tax=Rotaria magnacalcarata TaxID=392030 RepID=A0A8S3DLB2_9BILA|nr:unnamed protein product [Rotaria magnacalcarata]
MLRDDKHQHVPMESFWNSEYLREKLHRLENERSSLNLQIQVLTDKLELQRDTIQEYEQLQHRTKPKYCHPTTNTHNFYDAHVHQQPSFIHHVCTTSTSH